MTTRENINYNALMEGIIKAQDGCKDKKRLLLHACCAPCATACIERLNGVFDLTVLYYNPNIDDAAEYEKRGGELKKLCGALGVELISEEYNPAPFYAAAAGLEDKREGGARCQKCFELRMDYTAAFAKRAGFDYFCTTLTVSPHKNARAVNAACQSAADKYGCEYIPADFKKKGGYFRSCELSLQYGLYRQNYCGCNFARGVCKEKGE